MVIADFSGDFLNAKGAKDGDVVTILSECKLKRNDVLKKDMYDMDVEHNGKTKTYSPNNKAGQTLVTAFGKDTKDWIGHRFECLIVEDRLVIRALK